MAAALSGEWVEMAWNVSATADFTLWSEAGEGERASRSSHGPKGIRVASLTLLLKVPPFQLFDGPAQACFLGNLSITQKHMLPWYPPPSR